MYEEILKIKKKIKFQVVKPLYTDSLNSWVGHIPDDVNDDMAKIAPMLKLLGEINRSIKKLIFFLLGYDPDSRDPFYGKPDKEVIQKYNDWLKTQGGEVQNAPPDVDIGTRFKNVFSKIFENGEKQHFQKKKMKISKPLKRKTQETKNRRRESQKRRETGISEKGLKKIK